MTPSAEHPATLATLGDFSVLGPEHLHVIDSLSQLLGLYESWNRCEEAEKWRRRLVDTSDPGHEMSRTNRE